MLHSKNFMGSSQEPVTFLRSGKANLTLEKFNLFWSEGPSIGFYVLELIKYYCEIEKSKKVNGVSAEATISTLYFLILSGCYDPTDHEFQACIEDAKQRWDYHRQNHESFNPLTDEIITTVLNVSNNPDDHIHLVFSHSLLINPKIESFSEISYTNYFGQQYKIATPQDISSYAAKGFFYLSHNAKFCILDKGEFVLAYHFIKNYLDSLGYLPVSILDLFHRKIQEIIISLRANDFTHAQSSLLPLLHMMKNFLIKYPIISYDSMDALIIDLDIIRRWPIPYGSAASQLLEIVIKELKSPGSAMRYKIREEFPMIDHHFPIYENLSIHASTLGKLTGLIILDSSESLELGYFHKICNFNKKFRKEKIKEMVDKLVTSHPISLPAVYAHVNRCLIVLFSFSLYVEITITDLSHIAGLSTESIYGLYTKILQMVEKIENEEMDKARSMQEWFILELFEESKNLKSERANPLTEPLFVYLSDFEIYFPRFPLHQLSTIDLGHLETNLHTIEDGEGIVNDSNMSVGDEPLLDVIRQRMSLKDSSRDLPLKVILTGSDVIVHKFLRSYVHALVRSSKSLQEIDVRIYAVPAFAMQNTLAMFLASIDPWYARHVYVPFYSRPWLPRLDTRMDLKHISKKEIVNNEALLRALALDPAEHGGLNERSMPIICSEIMLQDYLLEASHAVAINVYKIKCFRNDSGMPDEIIPMCLYLEIGAHVAIKRLQEATPSLKDKSFLEIIDNKAFRFRSISLMLQMSQMDLLGNPCGIDEGVVKNIYSLNLANVPRENDRGMHALPQAEWLELSFLEREAVEQEMNLLKSVKNKKIKEPQGQVNIAINSLYSNVHVSGGKIVSTDNSDMEIIVDGVIYGPFKQVIIEPFLGDDINQIKLPLYTFLDTES